MFPIRFKMPDRWYPAGSNSTYGGVDPFDQNEPFRLYHSSDESDAGSPGGGGFRAHASGRDFIGGRHGPSFSSHDQLLVDDAPYLPPRDLPAQPQFVSPQVLHGGHFSAEDAQYFGNEPGHYRQHTEQSWNPHQPPPSYYDPYTPPQQMPTAMHPSAFQSSSPRFPDAGEYLRSQLNLSPGAAQPSLWSLPDPPNGQKPSIPLPMLIKLAIYGNPKKRLTLQEIYAELAMRFEWFREHQNDAAWKNSIRHNLSLNKVFKNIQRPVTEPGKGSYWELDISGGEGYKRPRKRNKKAGGTDDVSEDGSYSDNDHTTEAEYHPNARSRRRSPYDAQGSQPRVNTDRSRESSSPPTAGSSRGGSMPMIDPPASQRRTSTSYRQPAYAQSSYHGQIPIDPALQGAPTTGASSYYGPPPAARSSIPLESRPRQEGGRVLRSRPSLSTGLPSSSSGAPLSPTDEAYAKSRRRAQGRN